MLEYLIKGFLLGLSLSVSCLVTCGPIYGPIILMKRRTLVQSLFVIFEISLGRFITYAAFGLMAGFAGEKFSYESRSLFTGISYVCLSIFFIYYLIKQTKPNHSTCPARKLSFLSEKSPFIVGLVTVISFCPSFLLALTSAFEKAGVINGMFFFIAFFAGTSITIIPISLLSIFHKINLNIFKRIGFAATVIVICWFSFSGIKTLIHEYNNRQIINFLSKKNIYLIVNKKEKNLSEKLKGELDNDQLNIVVYYDNTDKLYEKLDYLNKKSHIIVTSQTLDNEYFQKNLKEKIKVKKFFVIEIPSSDEKNHNDNIYFLISKLKNIRFKVKNKGFLYSIKTNKQMI